MARYLPSLTKPVAPREWMRRRHSGRSCSGRLAARLRSHGRRARRLGARIASRDSYTIHKGHDRGDGDWTQRVGAPIAAHADARCHRRRRSTNSRGACEIGLRLPIAQCGSSLELSPIRRLRRGYSRPNIQSHQPRVRDAPGTDGQDGSARATISPAASVSEMADKLPVIVVGGFRERIIPCHREHPDRSHLAVIGGADLHHRTDANLFGQHEWRVAGVA
jgi:hypothetical protein